MNKIEIYNEVEKIRKHFQNEVLNELFDEIDKAQYPSDVRNSKTFEAEDEGFNTAKKMVLDIIVDKLRLVHS